MRRVCVFCGSATGARPEYAAAAESVGLAIAARGMGLVFGGGAVGLMGIVSRAALAAGAEVTGIIPHGLVMREAGNRDLPDLRGPGGLFGMRAMGKIDAQYIRPRPDDPGENLGGVRGRAQRGNDLGTTNLHVLTCL